MPVRFTSSLAIFSFWALAACGGGAPMPIATRPEPAPTRIGIVPPAGPYNAAFDVLHYAVTMTLPDTGKFVTARSQARLVLRDPLALHRPVAGRGQLERRAEGVVHLGGDPHRRIVPRRPAGRRKTEPARSALRVQVRARG